MSWHGKKASTVHVTYLMVNKLLVTYKCLGGYLSRHMSFIEVRLYIAFFGVDGWRGGGKGQVCVKE